MQISLISQIYNQPVRLGCGTRITRIARIQPVRLLLQSHTESTDTTDIFQPVRLFLKSIEF